MLPDELEEGVLEAPAWRHGVDAQARSNERRDEIRALGAIQLDDDPGRGRLHASHAG
jgi:hypothetical protein